MKHLIILFFFVFSSLVASKVLPILGLEETERDFVYQLYTSRENHRVLLDCASFFHVLKIQSHDEDLIYYLYADECWGLYEFFAESDRPGRCLIYNSDEFNAQECEGIASQVI